MRAVVAFESLYGHTRLIADAIAEGIGADEVLVTPVCELHREVVESADLIVIGAPAHTHSLPRPGTRKVAIEAAHVPGNDQQVDPSAAATGVREWLAGLPEAIDVQVAAFDTRFHLPAWVAGHPARRIGRALRRHGAELVVHPTSFYVDRHEQLRPGELERARQWGKRVGERARGRAASR